MFANNINSTTNETHLFVWYHNNRYNNIKLKKYLYPHIRQTFGIQTYKNVKMVYISIYRKKRIWCWIWINKILARWFFFYSNVRFKIQLKGEKNKFNKIFYSGIITCLSTINKSCFISYMTTCVSLSLNLVFFFTYIFWMR